jgi:uncharacterized membrane protein YphA (DoxX/SURF4 family)
MAPLLLVLSLVIGLVFAVAGVAKLRPPRTFVLSVMEYDVLPVPVAKLYAAAVPRLELLLGLCLLLGWAVRAAASMATILVITFLVGIVANLVRGRALQCNCFGAHASGRTIGLRLVVEDTALLIGSIYLAASSRGWALVSPWSLARLTHLSTAVVAAGVCVLFGVVGLAAVHSQRPNRPPLRRLPEGTASVRRY